MMLKHMLNTLNHHLAICLEMSKDTCFSLLGEMSALIEWSNVTTLSVYTLHLLISS